MENSINNPETKTSTANRFFSETEEQAWRKIKKGTVILLVLIVAVFATASIFSAKLAKNLSIEEMGAGLDGPAKLELLKAKMKQEGPTQLAILVTSILGGAMSLLLIISVLRNVKTFFKRAFWTGNVVAILGLAFVVGCPSFVYWKIKKKQEEARIENGNFGKARLPEGAAPDYFIADQFRGMLPLSMDIVVTEAGTDGTYRVEANDEYESRTYLVTINKETRYMDFNLVSKVKKKN